MNAFAGKQGLPGSAWRRDFAEALIRLRPDMNPDAVDELADSACRCHAQVQPDEAAKLYQRDSFAMSAGARQGARTSQSV